MRSLMLIFMFGAVIGLAHWAYKENVKTKYELTSAQKLQVSIGNSRSRLAILRAEWAYQNRPHRLRDLADMNYEHLQLLPLRADHFSRIEHVRFPVTPKLNLNELYVVEIANRGINND